MQHDIHTQHGMQHRTYNDAKKLAQQDSNTCIHIHPQRRTTPDTEYTSYNAGIQHTEHVARQGGVAGDQGKPREECEIERVQEPPPANSRGVPNHRPAKNKEKNKKKNIKNNLNKRN